MVYLLDTSIVLWALKYPQRLGPETTKIIKEERLYISVASIWEIIIKLRKGKLRIPTPAKEIIELLDAKELPITLIHVDQLTDIKLPHKDPFDAILVAQAKSEGFTLLTTDVKILDSPYPVRHAEL